MTSEDVEALSLDDLNVACAEACGWRELRRVPGFAQGDGHWWSKEARLCGLAPGFTDLVRPVPDYARDIRAAWGLAERMVDGGGDLELQLERTSHGYHWAFLHHRDCPVERGQEKNRGHGETPATALARLFLKARRASRVGCAGD